MSTTASIAMPKKPTEDGGKERKATTTARLPVELLRQARVVAAFRGIELGDYLVSLLERPVAKDYGSIVKTADPPSPPK